jgi:hypothetical protein
VHHCIDSILFLCQCCKLECLVPGRAARPPCDIDSKGLQISQTRYSQEQIAEPLDSIGPSTRVRYYDVWAHLFRPGWEELESVERPSSLLKLFDQLHSGSTGRISFTVWVCYANRPVVRDCLISERRLSIGPGPGQRTSTNSNSALSSPPACCAYLSTPSSTLTDTNTDTLPS